MIPYSRPSHYSRRRDSSSSRYYRCSSRDHQILDTLIRFFAGLILAPESDYVGLVADISNLVEQARHQAARSINGLLTATYWEVGRRIVEFEQKGQARAEYGEALLKRVADDLAAKHGKGFSDRNLRLMRAFYLGWQVCKTTSGGVEAVVVAPSLASHDTSEIRQTPSAKFQSKPIDISTRSTKRAVKVQPPSDDQALVPVSALNSSQLIGAFPLSWSHYARLLSVEKPHARAFYESEAIRGGWSVRQLARQIGTQFFERTSASKQQEAMLRRGQKPRPEDAVSARDFARPLPVGVPRPRR